MAAQGMSGGTWARDLALVVALTVGLSAAPAAAAPAPDPRPGDVVPGSYIVTLRPEAATRHVVADAHRRNDRLDTTSRYTAALNGFAARMSDAAARRLAADPRVVSVEPDRYVGLAASQPSAPWGLDRIDQRARPLSTTYDYNTTGAGVTVYVIDTGVRATHRELVGRVAPGFDAVDGTSTNDCDGHGTHVAATAAGLTYGVAKAATVVPLRVFPCDDDAELSDIVEAIDWITASHVPGTPAVANLSLGARGFYTTLDTAINNSVAAGVVYVVAAGNDNAHACDYMPASTASAITVAATAQTDAKAWFSNYGPCVDLFAPGEAITSATADSDTAIATWPGTSMAAPHVAGAAARYLQLNPTATPADVDAALKAAASTGVTSAGTGSPDALLFADPLPADTSAPALAGFALSPSSVDVSSAAGHVKAEMTVTDDIAGARAPSVTLLDRSSRPIQSATARLAAGTPNNGTWEATLTVPHGAPPGTWSVQIAPLEDLGGNTASSPGPGAGFINTVTVKSDVTAPAVRMTAPRARVTLKRGLVASWTTADSGTGVRSSDVRWRRANARGAVSAWSYPTGWQGRTSTTVSLRAATGYTYCFSARARDHAGNTSAWSAPRCTARPLDDRALTRSAGWTGQSARGYYAKTYVASPQRGATLRTGRVRTTHVALVATTCPRCGVVTVSLGSTLLKRVSLKRATARRQTLIPVATFAAARRGRIVVRSVSAGRRVEIDGVGTVAR